MNKIKTGIKKLSEGQRRINREIREKTAGYILAALGFVVGLAWNDAIKTLIDNIFPIDKNGISAKFIYALIVTIIIVVAAILLTKSSAEKE